MKSFHDYYNPKNEANDLVFLCPEMTQKSVSPGNPGFFLLNPIYTWIFVSLLIISESDRVNPMKSVVYRA